MSLPAGWTNPVTAPPGQIQKAVDPGALLPSRVDLLRSRLEFQRQLLQAGHRRFTPIQVTPEGVIFDGHHGARAAAELNRNVDVRVVKFKVPPVAASILHLLVR